jgi:hypothetical protein
LVFHRFSDFVPSARATYIFDNETGQALDLSVPKIVALFRFSGECRAGKPAAGLSNERETTQTLNLRE